MSTGKPLEQSQSALLELAQAQNTYQRGIVKLNEKDKTGSKKGAFYYKLDKRKYKANLAAFLNFVPKAEKYI